MFLFCVGSVKKRQQFGLKSFKSTSKLCNTYKIDLKYSLIFCNLLTEAYDIIQKEKSMFFNATLYYYFQLKQEE